MHLTLSDIAKPLDIHTSFDNIEFSGISKDTRTLTPKNLYIAIKGEQFDGHDFIVTAENNGAVAAIVDHITDAKIPQLIVPDTIAALGKISALWRNRFTLPLIGVTGSCGKTTLKNMIAAILTAACQGNIQAVLATQGNLNNNIGVPFTLADLTAQQRYGVIEMGMNHFGEIAYLTHLVRPQVAVINNVGAAHLQGVENLAGVARAKGEIFAGLPADGVAILNRDDAFFDFWHQSIQHTCLTFGLENAADISATLLPNTTAFLLKTPKGNIEITLPLLGTHNIMNALAATAATLAIGIELSAIRRGLENVASAPGRMHQHVLSQGKHLIDDTYNANPSSTKAAILALSTFPHTKILVLGDMKELGPDEQALHTAIGQYAKACGIDYLLTYGELSAYSAHAFGSQAEHFTDREKLMNTVRSYFKPQTTILVKGSRSMKMETIVHGLAPELAVMSHH